jgi:predicted SnoaL-like aldol condensation-catalyzing enzyme
MITRTALLASTLLASSALTALAASPSENKATAEAFIQALDNGEDLSSMVSSSYTEHQQNSGFTLEGMASLVPDDASLTIHRAIAGEDMVFLHIEQSGAATLARGDLFRFDDAGNITEHWGTLQAAVPAAETKSGNSMFDGVAEVNTASTLAADSAEAHLAATDHIFNQMDSDAVFASVTEGYIQHNPGGPNGPAGLVGMLQYLGSQGIALHKELKQSVVEGDFIVKLNFYSTTPVIPGFGRAIVFDIIRFAEDGRAAEHWDIVEEITDPEQIDDLF